MNSSGGAEHPPDELAEQVPGRRALEPRPGGEPDQLGPAVEDRADLRGVGEVEAELGAAAVELDAADLERVEAIMPVW